MKKRNTIGHPITSLASILLFGIFTLFLLLMLLFSARIYQQTIHAADTESTLGTAVSYITSKFRQHDMEGSIFSGNLDNIPALCFLDTINEEKYITYLYVDNGELKELFTQDGSSATASAGTTIAQIADLLISEKKPGFYQLILKDSDGNEESFYLCQNSYYKEAS